MWASLHRQQAEPTAATPRLPTPAVPDQEVLVAEDTSDKEKIDTPWRVILFNDEIHTFDEVILQLIKATGCSTAQAEKHAWTVHTRGKANVYQGSFEDCFRVQGILHEIQLITEIQG